MAKKDKRFVKTYSQGTMDVIEVLVDRETGSTTCSGPAAMPAG